MTEFVGPFELILNTYRIVQFDNYLDRHDYSKCFERVKKLTLLSSNSFRYLNVSNRCNIPYNHWHEMVKEKFSCDNCCGEHYYPYYLHPRDDNKIKKAKEYCAACRGGGGRGGGCSSVRDGRHQGYCKKWSNDRKYGDINDDVNGVQKRVNAWM